MCFKTKLGLDSTIDDIHHVIICACYVCKISRIITQSVQPNNADLSAPALETHLPYTAGPRLPHGESVSFLGKVPSFRRFIRPR